jgi:hypothetical protein
MIYEDIIRVALRRRASGRGAMAETPSGGNKKRAARTNAAPSDVQHPSQEVSACLLPF